VERYLSNVTENPNLTQADFHQLRKDLLETALPFFQKLAEQEGSDPELRGSRGQAYYRLARLHADMGDRENAVADYRRALEILEPLAAELPAVAQYRLDLALSHRYHGYALDELGRVSEAEEQIRKAISVQEQLVEVFPAEPRYRDELAESHNGLGTLLTSNSAGVIVSYTSGLRDEAQAQYRRALALREQLAADFPTVARYHRDVGGTLSNLADIRKKSGKGIEAVAIYEQAIRHQELALARNPKDPISRRFLCQHHNNLGLLSGELGRWAEAAEGYRKAVAGLESLAAEFPAVLMYRTVLGGCRMGLGVALADLGRWNEAEAHHRKALALQEKLAAEFPMQARFPCEVGGSLDNLAWVMERDGRRTEALTLYGQAIRCGEQAMEREPQSELCRQFQAEHHSDWGTLLAELGQRGDAEPHHRQALALREKLVAEAPADPDYRRELGLSHNRLSLWMAELGRWDEAEAEIRKALAIRDKLVESSQDILSYRIDQAGSHASLGHLHRGRGQPEQALDWYDKAINALEPIFKKESRYVPAREALRDARWGRALALDRLGRYQDAVRDWERAESLDEGRQRVVFQLGRAISQAHLKGNHREALAEADALAKNADGPTLAGLARLCALASAPLTGGQKPAVATTVREQYASRAVVLLRQAASKGFRDTLYLQKGTDLAPLRDRKDFQTLLADAEATTNPHSL
jgi:tetratricopeptide (TPR) repeat protein